MQKHHSSLSLASLLLLALPLLLSFRCQSTTAVYPDTSTREEAAFSAISVEGSFEVVLHRGSQQPILLDGQQLNNVITEVKDDKLFIKMDDDVKGNPSKIKVQITIPELQFIEIAGSGSVSSDASWGGDYTLVLSVAGSGQIDVPIAGGQVKAGIAGSGSITTSGNCNKAEVNIAGSGSYDGKMLISQESEVSIAGSGSALVNATERVQGDVAGSGSIDVYGNPPQLEKSVAGSGKIKRMQ